MRFLIVLCLFASVLSAPALVMHGEPEGEAPGFLDYVGRVGGASGVFLGEHNGAHWVLTANHVGSGGFTIGGVTYAMVADSEVQFSDIDLRLFQIVVGVESSLANLASLEIATTRFSGGEVYAAGYGGKEQGEEVQIFPIQEGSARGYSYIPGPGSLNWGKESGVSEFSHALTMQIITTTFREVEGSFLGVKGDSGGGFFQNIDGNWVLVGVPVGLMHFQEGIAAFDYNKTLAVDLGEYADRLYAAIPEPGAVGLCVLTGVAGWLFGVRRSRRSK